MVKGETSQVEQRPRLVTACYQRHMSQQVKNCLVHCIFWSGTMIILHPSLHTHNLFLQRNEDTYAH